MGLEADDVATVFEEPEPVRVDEIDDGVGRIAEGEKVPESARGYTSRRELSLHVDLAQIVGLMCVRQARSGGASQYASGLAAYEEIRAKRPDLLPTLRRGFPYHRRGEEAPGQPLITPYDIPVFSEREGRVSIFMVREIINAAYRELKRTFTPEEIEAIDAFRATARDLQFETRLEPGEASFLNNYTIMHARSEFEDWGDPLKNRLMLRLWLDAERQARPVVPNIHIYENEGGRSGIDLQAGRLPAVAAYRTPDELVRQPAAAG